ncbi:4-hydroxy-3-methylbut-2-en-1-yl diphosphate synthase, putative [Theileria equi strain WA]|uniref:4-hydroxy-3-methylbut-2-en-1-yl diphosphate synthase (ferredoxin), chloroplastic n=1 Tax=Theileria equi strain WA TaxID=1537102 RepID=L0AX91_THEEQ|nr:4-hydroxy-3-methylbut-2-en-1-yl diphosphate synthase, putative [Theileria equi strain WA]AFZ79641.1 4-hydroxy-3-methylbut-2-en-1-yl diphosphate synthase, putative [Theileria equi strain WA]|eukprot:XP_004829307.1 4-hydroxy-3-methylbut-2-en-1-yl diphosphate synthase, putative [Theileria equi strain WA]
MSPYIFFIFFILHTVESLSLGRFVRDGDISKFNRRLDLATRDHWEKTQFSGIPNIIGFISQNKNLCDFHGDKQHTSAHKKDPSYENVYCESISNRIRFPTRCVKIGKVTIGGNSPIALQTMTSSDTNDVDATVDQILKSRQHGASMVRLTVQSPREAKSSVAIKEKLLSIGCDIPLIADIHFNPKVALLAADVYDKVRVNPGNYVDGRKNWDMKVYETEEEFRKSGEFIEEMFTPLVEKCKKLKKAIRIGTNHGSLSSRIMSYYGDSPRGMVESALEFAAICVKLDFHDIVFSMKSSNVYVMTHAYRLLVHELYKRGWNYPIHLGVTEAGSVDDGRIKSALGIGTLLMDGIGDTIRMSLTEDPWLELSPARKLVECVERYTKINTKETLREFRNFQDIEKRELDYGTSILKYAEGGNKNTLLNPDGSVGCILTSEDLSDPITLYKSLGVSMNNGLPQRNIKSVDFVVLESVPQFHECSKQRIVKELIEGGIQVVAPVDQLKYNPIKFSIGLVDLEKLPNFQRSQSEKTEDNKDFIDYADKLPIVAVRITGNETDEQILQMCNDTNSKVRIAGHAKVGFIIMTIDPNLNNVATVRRIFGLLVRANSNIPVIHQLDLTSYKDHEDVVVAASTLVSCHLVDKLGEGLICKTSLPLQESNAISLNILQNARMRSFKTDFISCPSCGRTLFDIQKTTEEIKKRTGHLPGVTIAIMGCIVNGIGEMADADFGYVGGSPGKVDLYVKKQLVERGIPNDQACDRLIDLIKKHGRWIDP